jgi:hypothetical protein
MHGLCIFSDGSLREYFLSLWQKGGYAAKDSDGE